jgi:hypothetical protein
MVRAGRPDGLEISAARGAQLGLDTLGVAVLGVGAAGKAGAEAGTAGLAVVVSLQAVRE